MALMEARISFKSVLSGNPSLSPGFGRDIAELLEGLTKHIAGLPIDAELPTSTDRQRIPNLKQHLKDVRDVQHALLSLSNTVQSSISTLEKRFSENFIRDRYSQFPDDIFAIIFESAGFDDFRTAINISQVCRRFRTIVLSTPQLWTHIHVRYERGLSIADASEVARRSQHSGLGLTVEMQSFGVHAREHLEYLQSMMSFIGMHSSRISALTLDLGIAHAAAGKSKSWFAKLSLPVLASLKINAPPSSSLNDFYEGWEIPSLRVLHGRNCLPKLPSGVLSKMKSFSFEIEEYCRWADNVVPWSLTELADYLEKLSSLEKLKLDVQCHSPRDLEDGMPPPPPQLKTALGSLSVRIQDHDYSSGYTAIIFSMLDYENVSSLSISLPSEALPDFCTLFKHVKWASQIGCLKDLDFRIIPKYFPYNEVSDFPRTKILGEFLENNVSLENIYIECPGDDREVFGFSNRLAALQLKNCQLLRDDPEVRTGLKFLYDIEKIFKRRGDSVDEFLVLDGAKTSPLDETEIIKIPISSRDVASIRAKTM